MPTARQEGTHALQGGTTTHGQQGRRDVLFASMAILSTGPLGNEAAKDEVMTSWDRTPWVGWCVDMAEFAQFSAFDVLRYFVLNRPSGLTPTWWFEAQGGTRTYIMALAEDLRRTQIRRSAHVTGVQRREDGAGGYRLVASDGSAQEVDAVILATNARDAATLLAGLPGLEQRRRELERFEYFTTRIAVHGDRRLMPRQQRHWSVVNTRFDGAHSARGFKSIHAGHV